MEQSVHPRGYRLLSKVPRLPLVVVDRIVEKFGDLKRVLTATLDDLEGVEGVGPTRAKSIADGMQRLKEYNILERYI